MYACEDIIDSIYIGGGTPSILSEQQIQGIMDILKKSFKVKSLETTMEFNPEDVKKKKISSLLQSGIQRISLGVQSFQPKILQAMGRNHNQRQAIDAVEKLRGEGVTNCSFDLIFGYPGQTREDLQRDLYWIDRLQPDHISWYNLIVEKSTKLYRQKEKGLVFPKEDVQIEMYEDIQRGLSQLGYEQYEISNFAKKGKESIHNLKYWHYEDYYGFGIGASGSLYPDRWQNEVRYKNYVEKIIQGEFPQRRKEKLSLEEMAFEYILMNMRLTEGLSLEKYKSKFHRDFFDENKKVIEDFISSKHLVLDHDYLKFTKKGFEISNYIFTKFN